LIEEEYPSGRKVKNEFESDGDLSRIYGTANATATEKTYANSFTYIPDGRIERLKLGNGLWENAKFNSRLQVTELALGHGAGSGDIWKLGYEYGELQTDGTVDQAKNTGNVAKQTLSFNGLTHPFVQTYKQDSLHRLTEARETSNGTETWKQTFGYDRFGNRTGFTQNVGGQQLQIDNLTLPTIDPATNRFAANQGYLFDKNGNLKNDPVDGNRQFIFNGDNKQSEVRDVNGALIGKYFYDGEGRRVKKKVYVGGEEAEETVFVYSSGKLIAEYSTAAPPANPTTNYTVTDQLGSPRVIVNAWGEVVSRRDFMPFGEELAPDASNRTAGLKYGSVDSVRQKFTGYQKDDETGLDFAENRMYENRHARFTAIDPLLASGKSANPQTFNRYVYVLNNPLVLVDPDGLQVATATGKVYRNGNQFAIFRGRPFAGYKPVARTINTTTNINGVSHHVTVRSNGWVVGDRVDNARFVAASTAAPPRPRSEISVIAGETVQGVRDGGVGIAKGIPNAPAVALNGLGSSCNVGNGRLLPRP
jgi:RHS repeat-associated protein